MEYCNADSATGSLVGQVNVPQKLIDLNKVEGVYLAGGSLVRLVMRPDQFDPTRHDFDFFVVGETQEIREQRIRAFIAHAGGQAHRSVLHMVNILQDDHTKIQVIMTSRETIEQVVLHFDFSLSRLWLTPENQIFATPIAKWSMENKTNCVTTKHSIVCRPRINKYHELLQLQATVIDEEDKVVNSQVNNCAGPKQSIDLPFIPSSENYNFTDAKLVPDTFATIFHPMSERFLISIPIDQNSSTIKQAYVDADTEIYLNNQRVQTLPLGYFRCSILYNSSTMNCYKLWLRGNAVFSEI
jgi:hypothetical protein